MRHLVFGTVLSVALATALGGCGNAKAPLDFTSGGSGASAAPTGQFIALLNGSFEQDALGWDLAGAEPVAVGAGAYHGTRAMLIDPGSSDGLKRGLISTRVPTEVGREYRLSFAYQTGFDQGSPVLSVLVDGKSPTDVASVVRFFDPGIVRDVPSRGGWESLSLSFFAEHETTRIQIGPFSRWRSSIRWGKLWIDHVRLEALETTRTLGRDIAVRASLPSVVQVGEEVELTVSLAGTPKRRLDGAGSFDRRPLRHTCEFELACDDSAATLPGEIAFSAQHTRVERVRFGTPGVHRLTLATEDGFSVLSNPVRVVTEAPATRSYWGDIHVHTQYGHSDWIGGSGEDNYAHARDFADLDFAALSEHFEGNVAVEWMRKLQPATERFNEAGRFVTFIGVESYGYQGHTNHYLRGSEPLIMFDPRNRILSREQQLQNLRSRGAKVLSIPHHFMLLDPADWRETDHDSLRLAEIYSIHGSSEEAGAWWRHPDHFGPAYSDSRGARGHDYSSALARGHRVGVIACSDSHTVQPGLAGLTCVRSSELTRSALWDALHRRDCYGTTGERILFDFEVAGTTMGGELFLAPGAPLSARVEVHGQDAIEAVEILQGGQVVASASPGTLDYTGTLDLGVFDGESTSFYARVRQHNGHRAWTSPVWIDPEERSNLTLENRDLDYDHARGTLRVRAHNRGNLADTAGLEVYSSHREPSFGITAPDGFDDPALMLRVEPVSTSRVRLYVSFYLPRYARRTFRFSGQLWVQRANPNATRIAADPRGIVLNEGQGLFSWDELLGVEYLRQESLSGQITDFELEIDTRPDTILRFRPRVDGALVTSVYVGTQLRVSPNEIELPLGRMALVPPERRATVSLAPGETTAFTFGNLPPGATYVAVLGSGALDRDQDDNSARLSVPAMETGYLHWPDFVQTSQGLVFDPSADASEEPTELPDDSHSCWRDDL